MIRSRIYLACLSLIFAACGGPDKTEQIPEPVMHVSLTTGSRIAFIRFASENPQTATPVVFVGGDAGGYQVSDCAAGRNVELYRNLAQSGFEVYVYDQAGCGLSDRLADPWQYTIFRHVADLEALRIGFGGKPFILVGDSWGATLCAMYMAIYPGNTVKAVFVSPGPIDPGRWTELKTPLPEIPKEMLDWARTTGDADLSPRLVTLDQMMLADTSHVREIGPDSIMDPIFDRFTQSRLPSAVYDRSLVEDMEIHGMGWWSYWIARWTAANSSLRTVPILSQDTTRVLVLHGDADYTSAQTAKEYASTFPNQQYVEVAEAGHFLWLDKSDIYAKTVQEFLVQE